MTKKTEETKAKAIRSLRAAAGRAKAAAAGTDGQRNAAKKHAALIDAIVLNGGDLAMMFAALKTAARLLSCQLSKGSICSQQYPNISYL